MVPAVWPVQRVSSAARAPVRRHVTHRVICGAVSTVVPNGRLLSPRRAENRLVGAGRRLVAHGDYAFSVKTAENGLVDGINVFGKNQ